MANRILVSVEEAMAEPSWICKVEPFLKKSLSALGLDGREISVLFCGDDFIKTLNSEYRNVPAPTDVLSFESGEKYSDDEGEWLNMGDIVVSVPMLCQNARNFSTDENAELKRLLLHGALHLNGMDHGDEHIEAEKTPECEMLRLQEKILLELEEEEIVPVKSAS